MVRPRVDPLTRLLARIAEDPETHCWIPSYAPASTGYIPITVTEATNKYRQKLAHRFMYESLVGPIPDGMTLDHLCRRPACCNPTHLEVVTMKENLLRGEGVGALNARKTKCCRGHPFDEVNTRVSASGARVCRACARLDAQLRAAAK
jgi:hypothetical protein